ncbi:MAG: hypothetical protein Q7S31_04210 [bacterium]|nr:hypothetical protein [bacterium]
MPSYFRVLGMATHPGRRLQRGGLPVSPEHYLGSSLLLDWRLPAPAYAGHPAICCLDFPLRG